MTYISYYQSPIGAMTMASDGVCLTGLWFDGQKYDRAGLNMDRVVKQNTQNQYEGHDSQEQQELRIFQETRRWLDIYFAGEEPDFTPALNPAGSTFRKMVLDILQKIPYGRTITYGDIAKEVAKLTGKKSMSAQAVGGAVGHNPISVIIPCHRVMGSSGSLTGYAGGLDKKMYLLKLENIEK